MEHRMIKLSRPFLNLSGLFGLFPMDSFICRDTRNTVFLRSAYRSIYVASILLFVYQWTFYAMRNRYDDIETDDIPIATINDFIIEATYILQRCFFLFKRKELVDCLGTWN